MKYFWNFYMNIKLMGSKFIYKLINVCVFAKSFQSCPTLCDPIDGSQPGSPVPEIL